MIRRTLQLIRSREGLLLGFICALIFSILISIDYQDCAIFELSVTDKSGDKLDSSIENLITIFIGLFGIIGLVFAILESFQKDKLVVIHKPLNIILEGTYLFVIVGSQIGAITGVILARDYLGSYDILLHSTNLLTVLFMFQIGLVFFFIFRVTEFDTLLSRQENALIELIQRTRRP